MAGYKKKRDLRLDVRIGGDVIHTTVTTNQYERALSYDLQQALPAQDHIAIQIRNALNSAGGHFNFVRWYQMDTRVCTGGTQCWVNIEKAKKISREARARTTPITTLF